MNDEIKRILDYLGNDNIEKPFGMATIDKHRLLDYITNLQQENKDNLKCIKSIKEQLESVINENQRLLNKWFENNDKMVELIGEKEVYNESLKDYKSRIEKAVEYMKNTFDITSVKDMFDIMNKLEDILNGRSDE